MFDVKPTLLRVRWTMMTYRLFRIMLSENPGFVEDYRRLPKMRDDVLQIHSGT